MSATRDKKKINFRTLGFDKAEMNVSCQGAGGVSRCKGPNRNETTNRRKEDASSTCDKTLSTGGNFDSVFSPLRG